MDTFTFWVCAFPVCAALAIAALWWINHCLDKSPCAAPRCNALNCVAGCRLISTGSCILAGTPDKEHCEKFTPVAGE